MDIPHDAQSIRADARIVARQRLATQFETLAARLRAGEIDFPTAVVVLHDDADRLVQVEPLGRERPHGPTGEAVTIAALQRAVTRMVMFLP